MNKTRVLSVGMVITLTAGTLLSAGILSGCKKEAAKAVASGQKIKPATPPPGFVEARMKLRSQGPQPGPPANGPGAIKK